MRAIGKLAVKTLTQLGYRTTLHVVPGKTVTHYFNAISNSHTRAQAGMVGWGADYASAAAYLSPLFTCRSFLPASPDNINYSEFCDPHVDQAFTRALAGQSAAAPSASSAAWSVVDRDITNAAPWAPLVNRRLFVVVSRRVANLQWGILTDQIRVK